MLYTYSISYEGQSMDNLKVIVVFANILLGSQKKKLWKVHNDSISVQWNSLTDGFLK